jgi:hypothetical protein
MAMNASYLNAIRDHGQSIITHLGLVNGSEVEPSGGSPAYARIAETWTDDGNGVSRPAANRVFDVPAHTVAGWRGYTASSGGTNHGGANFASPTVFGSQGTFTLLAASTSITHSAV